MGKFEKYIKIGGIKRETYYVMDDSRFNRLVEHFAGRGYNFVYDMECTNDTSYTYYVDGELFDFDIEEVEDWMKEGVGTLMASQLLNYMCQKKFIPKGNYLIEVCW